MNRDGDKSKQEQDEVNEDPWGEVDEETFEKEDPKAIPVAYMNDKLIYRSVVHITGLALIVCLISILWLAVMDKNVPQSFVAISSGIVGIYGALFGVSQRP